MARFKRDKNGRVIFSGKKEEVRSSAEEVATNREDQVGPVVADRGQNPQGPRVTQEQFDQQGRDLTTEDQATLGPLENPVQQALGPVGAALGSAGRNLGNNLLANSNVLSEGIGLAPEGSADARIAEVSDERAAREEQISQQYPDSGLLRGLVRGGAEIAPTLGAGAAAGGLRTLSGLGAASGVSAMTQQAQQGDTAANLGADVAGGVALGAAAGQLPRLGNLAERGVRATGRAMKNNMIGTAGALVGTGGLASNVGMEVVGGVVKDNIVPISGGLLGIGGLHAVGARNSKLAASLFSSIGPLASKSLRKLFTEDEDKE